jgi:hypothetical protein
VSRRRKARVLLPRIDKAAFDAAMAPLPAEFVFQPWGYISAEFDPRPEPEPEAAKPASLLGLGDTQFFSVRDFVLATEFPAPAARTEEVASC